MKHPCAYKGTHLDTPDLQKLWAEIKSGTTPGWPAGLAFEYLIVRLFELTEARVSYPFSVPFEGGGVVEQLDGFVQSDGINMLLEIKDYDDKVNVEPIAKLRNQLLRRPSGIVGSVFSRSGFTKQAVMLASYMAPQAILLWSGEEIDGIVTGQASIREALEIKYARLLRDGLSYFDFRGELL